MTEPGLMRDGGVVVLSGPALRTATLAVLEGIKRRRSNGLPFDTQEAVACELLAAMTASGHSDVRLPPISEADPVEQPTVSIAEAATRLGISPRQARRRAKQLGGRKIAGRWLVAESAVAEDTEGRQ